jgi:hypothetical protein
MRGVGARIAIRGRVPTTGQTTANTQVTGWAANDTEPDNTRTGREPYKNRSGATAANSETHK